MKTDDFIGGILALMFYAFALYLYISAIVYDATGERYVWVVFDVFVPLVGIIRGLVLLLSGGSF